MKHSIHLILVTAGILLALQACTFDTSGTKGSTNNNTNNNVNNNNNNINNNNTNNTNNPGCGNGVIDTGETCDGTSVGEATCQSLGHVGGTLACAADCRSYDDSGCTDCGNGIIDGAETCDGTNLGGATCESLAFPGGGTLACTAACAFDTTGCIDHLCANGILEPTEQCDGSELNNATCQSLGFFAGVLACTNECTFDTGACHNCGNNRVDAPEQCDRTDLNNQTCSSRGFYTGELQCTDTCTFDESRCTNCGNGQLNDGEVCDGTDFGGQTCRTLRCRSDALPSCSMNCLSISLDPCKANHNEDGDSDSNGTLDDNCDNCPAIPNGNQDNGDGDEIGDFCERPNNSNFVSKIAYFEPFRATTGWSSTGNGDWTHDATADTIRGAPLSTSTDRTSHYLYTTNTASDRYAVEVTFHYAAAAVDPGHRAGVIFAYNKDGNGVLSRAYRCVFERNTNELQLWRYTTYQNQGWVKRTWQIANSIANYSLPRTIRAFVVRLRVNNVDYNYVACQYMDANNAYPGIVTAEFQDDYPFALNAQAGLTIDNETAVFRSFTYYAN